MDSVEYLRHFNHCITQCAVFQDFVRHVCGSALPMFAKLLKIMKEGDCEVKDKKNSFSCPWVCFCRYWGYWYRCAARAHNPMLGPCGNAVFEKQRKVSQVAFAKPGVWPVC